MGFSIKNVTKGITKSFSSPKNAALTVATGGLYGVAKENPKGAVGAASGGLSGLLASGGNPLGLILGAGAGAITGGTSKGNLKVIAGQGAVSGGIVGAAAPFLSTGYAALSSKLAALGASKGAPAAAGAAKAGAGSSFFGSLGKAYASQGVVGVLGKAVAPLIGGAKKIDVGNVGDLRDALNDKLTAMGAYPDGLPPGINGDAASAQIPDGRGGFLAGAMAGGSSALVPVLLFAVPGGLLLYIGWRLFHRKKHAA